MAKKKESVIQPKALVDSQYRASTSIMIAFIALTVLNIVFYLFGSQTFWVVSATVPWATVIIFSSGESQPMLIFGIVVAAVMVLGYVIMTVLGKKKVGWTIATIVFVIIDTLVLIALYVSVGDFSGIIDFLAHAYIIYKLCVAIKYGIKRNNAPEFIEGLIEKEEPFEDSIYIRHADDEVKFKKWLEAEFENKKIELRWVKKNFELVIDGYVYAEAPCEANKNVFLSAVVGGRLIEAGVTYRPNAVYIMADRCHIAVK